MQLKHTKLIAASVAALAAVAAAPAHAGALAMSDLNIYGLYLSDPAGNAIFANTSIQVLTEQRTLSNSANYNGLSGAGSGSDSVFNVGEMLDRAAVCVGPSCGSIAGALYGGNIENNATTHVGPIPTHNYALGDAYISGSALGGVGPTVISGLTRSDAMAAGPTNKGGSAANLINAATLGSTFTVGTSFAGNIAVEGNAYFNVWVDDILGQKQSASATMSWSITVTCDGPIDPSGTTDCASFNGGSTEYKFAPAEFNINRTTTRSSNNFTAAFDGKKVSNSLNFVAGNQYTLTIGQSTLANVSSLPEPASLALVGLAIAGLGVASRRRAAKK